MPEMTVPEKLQRIQELATRARAGDEGVLPELRRVLNQCPGLYRHFGNLATQVRESWITAMSGNNLHLRECLRRHLEEKRKEVEGDSTNPLEALLVERLLAIWVQCLHADAMEAQATTGSIKVAEFRMKRADRLHARFMSAWKALTTARALLPAKATVPTAVDQGSLNGHSRPMPEPDETPRFNVHNRINDVLETCEAK